MLSKLFGAFLNHLLVYLHQFAIVGHVCFVQGRADALTQLEVEAGPDKRYCFVHEVAVLGLENVLFAAEMEVQNDLFFQVVTQLITHLL